MRRSASVLALIVLTLALTTHPALAQTPAETANTLFEAEDWPAAAKAYEALLKATEDPTTLPVQAAVRGAVAHSRSGHPDPAFEWLGRAVELGLPVGFMDSLPALADLRKDERYAELRLVAERKSFPCKHQPRYRDFDFWIGTWDVFGPGGAKAGTNTITRASEGCILYESWQNTAGTDGHSINYVDPATDQWVQVWMGSDGSSASFSRSRPTAARPFRPGSTAVTCAPVWTPPPATDSESRRSPRSNKPSRAAGPIAVPPWPPSGFLSNEHLLGFS